MRAFLATVTIAGAVVLTACTSSASGGGPTGSAGSSAPPATSVSGSSGSTPARTVVSSPVNSASSSPSPAPTLTTAPSTTSSSPIRASNSAASTRPCTTTDLGLVVRKEGAVPNAELALITFTNRSSTACAMNGFPAVSLRLGVNPLGQPAAPSTKTAATVVLASGAAASTTLTDHTTCQADLSDSVRVAPPNAASFPTQPPVELRGCSLTVDPVAPAS